MDIIKSGVAYSITDTQGDYDINGEAIVGDTIELRLGIDKHERDDTIITTRGSARYTQEGINYTISRATSDAELSDLLYTKLKFIMNKLITDYGTNE